MTELARPPLDHLRISSETWPPFLKSGFWVFRPNRSCYLRFEQNLLLEVAGREGFSTDLFWHGGSSPMTTWWEQILNIQIPALLGGPCPSGDLLPEGRLRHRSCTNLPDPRPCLTGSSVSLPNGMLPRKRRAASASNGADEHRPSMVWPCKPCPVGMAKPGDAPVSQLVELRLEGRRRVGEGDSPLTRRAGTEPFSSLLPGLAPGSIPSCPC